MTLYRNGKRGFKCGSSQQGNNYLAPFAWMCDVNNHLSQFNNFYNYCFKYTTINV